MYESQYQSGYFVWKFWQITHFTAARDASLWPVASLVEIGGDLEYFKTLKRNLIDNFNMFSFICLVKCLVNRLR